MTATIVPVKDPKVNQPDEWVFEQFANNQNAAGVEFACTGYAWQAAINLTGWGQPTVAELNRWQMLTARRRYTARGNLRRPTLGRAPEAFIPLVKQDGMEIITERVRGVGHSNVRYSTLAQVMAMLEPGDAAVIGARTPNHAFTVYRKSDGKVAVHDNGYMMFYASRKSAHRIFEGWQGKNIDIIIVVRRKPEPKPEPKPEVKVNNRQRAWQLKAAEEGLCIKCGQPSTPARRSDSKTGLAKICKTCTDKDTARRRARKATAAA